MPRRKAKKLNSAELKSNEVIIKRYGNRRLYNTETGGYVTYEDLINLIREGRDIKVVDSVTSEDVTKTILIQLILEEEKRKKAILPTEFLFQLLRSREEAVQDFFKNHLAASFEAYLRTKEEFDKRFRAMLEMASTAPQLWEKLIPGAEIFREILTGKKREDKENIEESKETKNNVNKKKVTKKR
ncbi:MAG: polyhydroxyalkanoate synthesis repressor PhaR [Acidobacteria bacterium]|jgi:polyhydroxyalkanoate synthesis repressor PhaR|nr:MAG: polyhydroxyalkanoate synthesis repressor PhaR [Acidobacteriota bacterium]GIU82661.1 MAG: hypothetical protein KatS3mg006_1725 [Pyrinomonadaceae bacterium]